MNEIIQTINISGGTTFGNNIMHLVLQSGPVAKVVLLILLLFSLGSWGVILDKWLLFRKNRRLNAKFLKIFREAEGFDAVSDALGKIRSGPMARIFLAGYHAASRKTGEDRERIVRHVESAVDDMILLEIQNMEKRIPFLGTCGSVTPFIGLFGTVWGIINAFQNIGAIGSASIAAVAPGIAEALIATAAGLVAAVPSVIAYNTFLNSIRNQAVAFERFRTRLVSYFE